MTKGEAMRSAERYADERQQLCYVVEHRPDEWSLSATAPLGIGFRSWAVQPRKPGGLQHGERVNYR